MGVEQGDIEFAVITLPSVLPDKLIKQTIWQDELNIVVGRDHPLAAPSRKSSGVSLQQLARFPCVLTSEDTETHQIISREFEVQNLILDVQMQTNNLETLKMLTAAGLGWSILPKTMNDSTMIVLKVDASFSRELGLVIHNKRVLSKAAHVLKTLIENG
jgi:DNA-binding transcriptional LysR family regulator